MGTTLATISTGEHYLIDLAPGVAFGCFAASLGLRRIGTALINLGVVLAWSLGIRFGYSFLAAHETLLRFFTVSTLAVSLFAVVEEWVAPTKHERDLDRPSLAGELGNQC